MFTITMCDRRASPSLRQPAAELTCFMEKVWKEIRRELKKRVAPHSYRMWVEPLEASRGGEETEWVITCPNAFSRKRVQDHFGEVIAAEFQRILGRADLQIAYQVAGRCTGQKLDSGSIQLPLPSETIRPHNGRFLRRAFTFDQFVVGSSNDFAYSASLALASRRESQQPALFLFSGTGLGKSHLSQAIGHHVLNQNPDQRVYYMTAEDFSNEMVQAYRHD